MLHGHHIWPDVRLQVKNDNDLYEGYPKIINWQLIMTYGFQTLSEVPMNQIWDNQVLNRGQM